MNIVHKARLVNNVNKPQQICKICANFLTGPSKALTVSVKVKRTFQNADLWCARISWDGASGFSPFCRPPSLIASHDLLDLCCSQAQHPQVLDHLIGSGTGIIPAIHQAVVVCIYEGSSTSR